MSELKLPVHEYDGLVWDADDRLVPVDIVVALLNTRALQQTVDAPKDAPNAPIPMVLHCPKCRTQHIDAPEPERDWTNPPHKSHLCHGCGTIWRPADVPTNGVEATATRGSADTWPDKPAPAQQPTTGEDGSVRCSCEWAALDNGTVHPSWPAMLDPKCAVHGAPPATTGEAEEAARACTDHAGVLKCKAMTATDEDTKACYLRTAAMFDLAARALRHPAPITGEAEDWYPGLSDQLIYMGVPRDLANKMARGINGDQGRSVVRAVCEPTTPYARALRQPVVGEKP